MAYIKTIYQDSPSTATPLNAQNLNHGEDGIENNDRRITAIENAYVSSFNGRTGAVTPADGDYDIGQIAPLTGAQVGQVPVVTNIGTEEDPELVFRMGAGGGAGGHEIIDSEGNTMPQEENLQFVGLKVTDDSTNGRTIVDATDKVTWEANGVLGAKNLILYPYYETTKTVNGITFTDNGDGTITVSGTASADATIICHNRLNTELKEFRLKNGIYIITGCPSGGSTSTYFMGCNRTYNNANNNLAYDTGEGATITLNGDDYGADGVNLGVYITVKKTTSISTPIIFKPMIRLATDTDPTYQPYAMTNYELTKKIRELETALIELGGN